MSFLCSNVSPHTCGCCWDIPLWWSSIAWPVSSPGYWSSPSLFPRWMHGPWVSFFSWLLRTSLSPPAYRGRSETDLLLKICHLPAYARGEIIHCRFYVLATTPWQQGPAVLLPCCKLVLLQVHRQRDQCVRCQYPLLVCMVVCVCGSLAHEDLFSSLILNSDLLPLVIIALIIGYNDRENQYTSYSVKFAIAIGSIIPLSYYIGMGIARWVVFITFKTLLIGFRCT